MFVYNDVTEHFKTLAAKRQHILLNLSTFLYFTKQKLEKSWVETG